MNEQQQRSEQPESEQPKKPEGVTTQPPQKEEMKEVGEAQKSADTTPAKHPNMKWIAIVGGALILIVGVLFASYWMVYQTASDNAVTQWMKQSLPLPAAKVNGEVVLLRDFENRVRAIQHFYSAQESLGLNLVDQRPTDEDLRSQELDRMVDVKLLEEVASERGVSVSQDDINTYFDQSILPQAEGGITEVEKTLTDLYGWTVDEFKKYVVYETVLQQRVSESYSNDTAIQEGAKTEADEVYQKVIAGEKPFEELAKEFSDEPGADQTGGVLGSFGKGEMVAEFEEAAFALAKDQISQPVKTIYGYHIIKVTNRDDAAGTVEASHILIAFPSINELLEEKRANAKVVRMMPKY